MAYIKKTYRWIAGLSLALCFAVSPVGATLPTPTITTTPTNTSTPVGTWGTPAFTITPTITPTVSSTPTPGLYQDMIDDFNDANLQIIVQQGRDGTATEGNPWFPVSGGSLFYSGQLHLSNMTGESSYYEMPFHSDGSPYDASAYNSISFDASMVTAAGCGNVFHFYVRDGAGVLHGKTLTSGGTVTFTELGVNPSGILAIRFDMDYCIYGVHTYIDNVRFTNNSGAATPVVTSNSPTNTPTNTPTTTPTQTPPQTTTNTPSITPTLSATPSATITSTACMYWAGGSITLPANPVSGGTTAMGYHLSVIQRVPGCGPDPAHFGYVPLVITTTGNLATEILGIQVWSNGVQVSSLPFSNSPLVNGSYTNDIYILFVLSPYASGTVQVSYSGPGMFGYATRMGDLLVVNPASGITPITTYSFTDTPTATPSNTPTLSPTQTPTLTPTSTPTGCARVNFSSLAIPSLSAAAGMTAVGYVGFFGNYATPPLCMGANHFVTKILFTAAATGNLDTEIIQVQLWQNGTLAGTCPYNSAGMTITGSPLLAQDMNFILDYVLSPAASGTVQTTFTTNFMQGYGNMGFGLVYQTFTSGILTVSSSSIPTNSPTVTTTNTPTPSPTLTPTNSPTLTPSKTPTPTPSPAASVGTMTPTGTPTPVPTLTPTVTPILAGKRPVAYPNPATGNSVIISLPFLQVPSDIHIQVFTVSYRKVRDLVIPRVLPGTQVTLTLLDKWGKPLSNGLYYVMVDSPRSGKYTIKLLVQR